MSQHYLWIPAPDHPKASSLGVVNVHILVAEQKLGRPLKKGEVVHHIDGNKHNNTPENLQVCPSQKAHMEIHYRERALKECGHADWIWCTFCKTWSPPVGLRKTKGGTSIHLSCEAKQKRQSRARNPEKYRETALRYRTKNREEYNKKALERYHRLYSKAARESGASGL